MPRWRMEEKARPETGELKAEGKSGKRKSGKLKADHRRGRPRGEPESAKRLEIDTAQAGARRVLDRRRASTLPKAARRATQPTIGR